MIRQLIACLVILVIAGFAWVSFAPGAQQTLANYGIALPFIDSEAGAEGGPPGGFRGFGAGANNVVTTPVALATVNDSLSAIGEGAARRSVTVTAPAGGTLNEVLVEPGETVEAGQVIARLDSRSERIALDRARISLENAQATLDRQEELARSNLVANSALSAAQLDADNAELEVRSAELALEQREITSPIAGTVGFMEVTPGNYLGAQTAVTTIEDISDIRINFWVPERYATSVRPGLGVEVSPTALPGEQFSGEITAVDNRIESESRTLQVQATIPNEDGRMRAGMSFAVSMRFPGQQFTTVDPLSILWSAEGAYVWKYDDGQATRVMTEIVQRNSDGVLVRAELQPGDAIITEGLLQLGEGDEVTLLSGPDGTETTEAAEVTPQSSEDG